MVRGDDGVFEHCGNFSRFNFVSSDCEQANGDVGRVDPLFVLHPSLLRPRMKSPPRVLHHAVTWGVLCGCNTPRGISYTRRRSER